MCYLQVIYTRGCRKRGNSGAVCRHYYSSERRDLMSLWNTGYDLVFWKWGSALTFSKLLQYYGTDELKLQ